MAEDRQPERAGPTGRGQAARGLGRRGVLPVVAAARDRGLLLYSSTGCVDGRRGDLVMLGPPLVVTDAEVDELVDLTAQSVEAATS